MSYSYDRQAARSEGDEKSLYMALSAARDAAKAAEKGYYTAGEGIRDFQSMERPLTYALAAIRDVEDDTVKRNLMKLWQDVKHAMDEIVRPSFAEMIGEASDKCDELVKAIDDAQRAAKNKAEERAIWDAHNEYRR